METISGISSLSQTISLRTEMLLPMNKQILILAHQAQSTIGKSLTIVDFI